jgi:endonuclease III
MKSGQTATALIEKLGGNFSSSLDIDLEKGSSIEIFKWFLASILFGARISEKIVVRTYREFEARGILTPQKILDTGWDGLVDTLDAGGYVRYDFKTATKLLEVMGNLKEKYQGDLTRLHDSAESPNDLERRLRELGKGIGQVTVNIFLRELRGIWKKADPLPQSLVVLAANNLGLVETRSPQQVLLSLKQVWKEYELPDRRFSDFESSLVRLGKTYCRRGRCTECLMKNLCLKVRC